MNLAQKILNLSLRHSSEPTVTQRDTRSNEMHSWDVLLVVCIIAILYLISYLTNPSVPRVGTEGSIGWLGWFDQGEYHKTARDLANLELRPSTYWYGYPLLGAFFYHWIPNHPFLIPDLALVCGIAVFLYRICLTFISRIESILLTTVCLVLDPQLWGTALVIPWNSLPIYFAIFATSWFSIFDSGSRRGSLWAALSIGFAGFCRPPDIPALLVIYYCGLIFRRPPAAWRWLVAAPLIAVGCFLALQFSAHLALYHSLISPYIQSNGDVGFCWSRFPLKVYQWLVDPNLLTGDSMLPPGTRVQSVIERLPHVLIIGPGTLVIIKETSWRAVGILAAFAVSAALYLGFNASAYPPHHWSYLGFHHFWWFAPWSALAAWLTVRSAWRVIRPAAFLLLLVTPTTLVSLFAYKERVFDEIPVRANSEQQSSFRTLDPVAICSPLPEQAIQIVIPLPAGTRIDALRIVGTPAVPFHASTAGSHLRIKVALGGIPLLAWKQYLPVGTPGDLRLSFINHPILLREPSTLLVTVSNVEGANPTQVQFLQAVSAPGVNLQRWEGRILTLWKRAEG